ncbi:hypothetical protein [Pseudoduganella danionis]|jgi:hypothetical protein|uniref:hypothetical protein n=1 Tax=Pseudoduganella danionis TaxID=1890295 RepID=UPI0035B24624
MMQLIASKQGKNDKYDQLRCVRSDGSTTGCMMPRQGVLPHDLIHYVVETALAYRHGFLGMVAAGADIGYAMEQSHAYDNPALAHQAIHAEAIVESLQAQLWSGAFDQAMFDAGLESACAMRGCAAPVLENAGGAAALYESALALGQRWQQLAYYGTLELAFPPA